MDHDGVQPEIVKSEEEWKRELGAQRYHVLREAGTERPFSGSLCDVDEAGVYRCGACGASLFAAEAKFASHCGWPSFTHPDQERSVRLLDDGTLGMHRIEVRCRRCDSHLGHVFDDGPGPANTRYCINSLALRFEPSRSTS
ncbi:MAG: peptide-methionine (R)-S-oxide reductase MsrB [Candidatus Tyrphobacter sp.]